jgi:hypothetical protein
MCCRGRVTGGSCGVPDNAVPKVPAPLPVLAASLLPDQNDLDADAYDHHNPKQETTMGRHRTTPLQEPAGPLPAGFLLSHGSG